MAGWCEVSDRRLCHEHGPILRVTRALEDTCLCLSGHAQKGAMAQIRLGSQHLVGVVPERIRKYCGDGWDRLRPVAVRKATLSKAATLQVLVTRRPEC